MSRNVTVVTQVESSRFYGTRDCREIPVAQNEVI